MRTLYPFDPLRNSDQNPVQITFHLIILETQYGNSQLIQILRSLLIMLFLINRFVHIAINFDRECMSHAVKIKDVRSICVLTAELNTIQPISAQRLP